MPSEIEQKVTQHGHEIAYIKDALGQALEGIGSLNKNMSELCLKLSIYIERHEHTQESIKRLHERCERLDGQHNEQALTLATHAPVIEQVRSMTNKILVAFIAGLCLIAGSGYLALSSGVPA